MKYRPTQGQKQNSPLSRTAFAGYFCLVAGTRNHFCHNIVGLLILWWFGEFEDAEQLAAQLGMHLAALVAGVRPISPINERSASAA